MDGRKLPTAEPGQSWRFSYRSWSQEREPPVKITGPVTEAIGSSKKPGCYLRLIFELTFTPHIKHVVKTVFYHLKNIARVRPILSLANAKMLVHAFISSRIDYCHALLSGLPKKRTLHLQLLQNSAARVLTRTRRRAHITLVLKSLHWLPVSFRIAFKVLLMVFKYLNGLAPFYLLDLLLPYEPLRTLRPSGTGLFTIPKVNTRTYGEAAFQYYAPHLWNSLPENLRRT